MYGSGGVPPPPIPPVPHERDSHATKFAVFVGGDLHARERRRTHARDFLFGIALEHDLHRLAASGLRELRRRDAPAIRAKLAAESAADVLLHHLNISCRNAERF